VNDVDFTSDLLKDVVAVAVAVIDTDVPSDWELLDVRVPAFVNENDFAPLGDSDSL